MQKHYEIRPSKSQLVFLLTGHGLVAIVIIFYLQPGLLQLGSLALVLLLAVTESRYLIRQDIIKLRLDPKGEAVEFEQGGQPYFYSKNKVYQTRWFAILKLVDEHQSRTLILNPDRFKSIQCYRQMRYLLRQMEQRNVA